MWLPPVFQIPPVLYQPPAQTVVMSFLPQDEVAMACRPFVLTKPQDRVMGCAISNPSGCIVRIPTPQSWRGSGDAYLNLIEHELGHCAGWPASHPSGR